MPTKEVTIDKVDRLCGILNENVDIPRTSQNTEAKTQKKKSFSPGKHASQLHHAIVEKLLTPKLEEKRSSKKGVIIDEGKNTKHWPVAHDESNNHSLTYQAV